MNNIKISEAQMKDSSLALRQNETDVNVNVDFYAIAPSLIKDILTEISLSSRGKDERLFDGAKILMDALNDKITTVHSQGIELIFFECEGFYIQDYAFDIDDFQMDLDYYTMETSYFSGTLYEVIKNYAYLMTSIRDAYEIYKNDIKYYSDKIDELTYGYEPREFID